MKKIELIVKLIQARIEILKIRADDYTWQCYIDKETKEQLLNTLKEIDEELIKLRS